VGRRPAARPIAAGALALGHLPARTRGRSYIASAGLAGELAGRAPPPNASRAIFSRGWSRARATAGCRAAAIASASPRGGSSGVPASRCRPVVAQCVVPRSRPPAAWRGRPEDIVSEPRDLRRPMPGESARAPRGRSARLLSIAAINAAREPMYVLPLGLAAPSAGGSASSGRDARRSRARGHRRGGGQRRPPGSRTVGYLRPRQHRLRSAIIRSIVATIDSA